MNYNTKEEFEIYKTDLIIKINNEYNSRFYTLYINTLNQINAINKSRYYLSVKKRLINNSIKNYNIQINKLKKEQNNKINNIKNIIYIPPKLESPIQNNQNEIIIQQPPNKNALLIGINYANTQHQLNGCINDVQSLNNFLITKHFNSINTLTDNTINKPTRNNILNAFKQLLNNSTSGDTLFFSYSGHGTYVKDTDKNEYTGYDQVLVPSDLNLITDDELNKIIHSHLKPNVELVVLMDCCFSGTVLDLKYNYIDSLFNNVNTENNNNKTTSGSVIMISGCSDIQTSADAYLTNKYCGAMTWAFLNAYKKNITWKELLITMRETLNSSNFTQIPQLSSGKPLDINSVINV